MAAAAVLWVLSLLVVVFAYVAGTPRRTGARLMLIALVGFLVAAAGGTWERMRFPPSDEQASAPALPTKTIVARDVPPDADGNPGRAVVPTSAGDGPAPGDGSTPVEGAADGGATPPADAQPTDAPPDPPSPIAAPSGSVPAVDPLPADPDARAARIRTILRDTSKLAEEPGRCRKREGLAEAWAQLQLVPNEKPWAKRAKKITDGLEACRRKLLHSISRAHRRTLVDGRDAFAEELGPRLRKEHDLRINVKIQGMSHEKLRVGGSGLDQARVESLMNGGLRGQLRSLQFASVVFSDGNSTKTYDFTVTPENVLGQPDLEAVGLGAKLERP